jgi:hypothetical protein
VIVVTRPTAGSGPASSSTRVASNVNVDLAFGMTPRQVERVTGKPTSVRAGCWLFLPQHGMVGSISMGPPGSPAARSTGDLKLCFYGGVFSTAFRHFFSKGAWQWVAWVPHLTVLSGDSQPSRVG